MRYKPLAIIAFAAVTAGALGSLRRTHRRRLQGRSVPAASERLQAWEGEGGGLPDGGPQRAVEPEIPSRTPQASSPPDF